MSSTANIGHFRPMVAYAGAARRAGHEILFVTPDSFVPEVTKMGYAVLGCGDIPPATLAELLSPDRLDIRKTPIRIFGIDGPGAMLPGVFDAIDSWRPDLLVRDPLELASFVAAEVRGIPQLQVVFGFHSELDQNVELLSPLEQHLRSAFGLALREPAGRYAELPSVTTMPPSYDLTAKSSTGAIHRFRTELTAPTPLPDWWGSSKKPLVYATFGTVAVSIEAFRDVFRNVVKAVGGLPVRVLATTGEGATEVLRGMSSRIHVEEWVSHADAAEASSVVVCHGGSGTVQGTLRLGKPLLILPQFADQPLHARRVAEVDAGLALSPADATSAAIRAAVVKLLSQPGYGLGSRRIAAEMSSQAPLDTVVDIFEQIAGRRL